MLTLSEDVIEDEEFEYASPPPVFISYQWGFQNEVKLLKHHLNMAGYECWLDVGQMGGGDKLFAKIDNGIRGAKIVICCVTEKYAQSPNCNREVGIRESENAIFNSRIFSMFPFAYISLKLHIVLCISNIYFAILNINNINVLEV